MLLHRSAPLATVDHFNGELLALTSLSAKREGSQKKRGSSRSFYSNKKKNKGKVRESPLKTPISTSTTSVAGHHILDFYFFFFFALFSGKILEDNCADAAAKMTFTYNNLMKKKTLVREVETMAD